MPLLRVNLGPIHPSREILSPSVPAKELGRSTLVRPRQSGATTSSSSAGGGGPQNGTTTTTAATAKDQQQQQPPQQPTQRYVCTDCKTHFCIDCDIFAHESLHFCPGCQSLSEERIKARAHMWPPSNGDGDKDAPGEPAVSMGTQVAEATRMLEKSKIAPGTSMEVDS
ncbi:hypothetical protein TWF281_005607 [Arthrobotrys megalospora]